MSPRATAWGLIRGGTAIAALQGRGTVFASLAAKIRWLLILAPVLGPVVLVGGLWHTSQTRDVLANGLETSAIIEGGNRDWSTRRGEQFMLTLAWTDSTRQKYRIENHYISSDFAAKIVTPLQQAGRNDSGPKPAYGLLRGSALIRYAADRPDAPIILEDAAYRQGADYDEVRFGIIISLIGVVCAAIYFIYFIRRHRRAEAV